ncbi:SANT and BTB domain regulator of class switch recombination [Chironomus tepperi]|uniref:SANT and BTB domain regulator of class switch recombination n=1 Tax=Chironomus tepperi TaxID=113505 RepID=UPI00391F680E
MSLTTNVKEDNIPDAEQNNVGVISMHDFLHFLKLSVNVNDTLDKQSKNPNFNFEQLSKNDLVNNLMRKYKSIADTSFCSNIKIVDGSKEDMIIKRKRSAKGGKNVSLKSKVGESCDNLFPNLNPTLTEKLDEVLGQGILDSLLPYISQQQQPVLQNKNHVITPSSQLAIQHTQNAQNPSTSGTNLGKIKQIPPNQKSMSSSSGEKKTNSIEHNGSIIFSQKSLRKKSPLVIDQTKSLSEPELTIHVCDEVKGVSRDFTCPQKLLISKMGYFADITSGQRLEDMDISVHCDLDIFDWLIKWVKKETLASQDNWPKLNASNVIPILVSASFLQMEPLLLDCLSYCHAHLSDVVKISPNLGCLNDNIISRLAAMFTNLELEMVKDKKDRIQPRLFCKLIQSLCEVEAQSLRGHYASLAGLFRCIKCGKYVTQTVSTYVHCVSSNMKLNRWGQIISSHVRDTNWSLSNYVSNLYKELRSWRKTYWRLWATCHFLYCSICETHFPASQLQWCMFHPEPPQFLTSGNPNETGKIGRYPCCGLQLAYRFESVTSPFNGCQYREHCVVAENDRDRAILNLVNQVSENNLSMFESPPTSRSSSASNSNEPWWNGMSILNSRVRQGILPSLHIEDIRFNNRKFRVQQPIQPDSSSETESSDYALQVRQTSTSTSSSDGEESECGAASRTQYKSGYKRRLKTGCRSWSANLSARSNQDNQREFEERAMKQIMSIVTKKTGIGVADQTKDFQTYQQGGIYIKLENEWKEALKHRNVTTKVIKQK